MVSYGAASATDPVGIECGGVSTGCESGGAAFGSESGGASAGSEFGGASAGTATVRQGDTAAVSHKAKKVKDDKPSAGDVRKRKKYRSPAMK